MKKLLFSLLLLCSAQFSPAQINWLETGQKWKYKTVIGWNPNVYIDYLEVEGDTVVAGQSCRKIKSNSISSPDPSNYIFAYEISDKVFAYDSGMDEFFKIYDFDMIEGETLTIPSATPFEYRVDSIGMANIGDFTNVRFQKATILSNPPIWFTEFYIIEGIGMAGSLEQNTSTLRCSYFFPHQVRCDYAIDGMDTYLMCFSEGSLSFNPSGQFCEIVSTEVPVSPVLTKASPNPVTTTFNLLDSETVDTITSLLLFNATGRPIQIWNNIPDVFDISDLCPGFYYLSIRRSSGTIHLLKVVKI